MSLQRKLDDMVGKSYMYLTIVYKILSSKISYETSSVEIETDKKMIVLELPKAERKLNEFLPVRDRPAGANISGQLPVKVESVIYEQIQKDLPNLTDVIRDNIKKLRTDKSYISQASAINESVNSLINLVKLEIMVKKLKGI